MNNLSNTLLPFESSSSELNSSFQVAFQQDIETSDPHSIDLIFFNCGQVKNGADLEKIEPFLIQVFPQFNEEQLRRFSEKYLPILIAHASPSKQQMLALLMACWYVEQAGDRLETALPSWLQAMHYYAKAIQIALFHNDPELKKIDFLGSEVFIRLIQYSLIEKEAFQNKLISLTKVTRDDSEAFQQFELSLRQISHLQRFYLKEEDFNLTRTLYKQAAVVLTKIPSDLEVKFRDCSSLISEELSQNVELPAQLITEKYREALQAFRKAFDRQDVSSLQTIQDIRTYQKEVFQAFKTLFNTLLEDAFVILGPPPSSYSQLKHRPPFSYDIRAMGSVGREEVCPYSDLEFMILVEDANAIDYFKKIVQILEIQVASLGETSTNNPVFTCIHVKNISGFHIDSSPTLNKDLIQTPAAMASLQNTPVTDPQTIENTVLKTTSLASTSSTLFTDYQTHLRIPMRACREERAFQFFLARSADYKKHWKSPFHSSSGLISIKTHFVEVLNHLLSDMALFCGIEKTNTLDIIEALVKSGIFNEASGQLLQESVAKIYAIRVRLHLYYQRQKEVASCSPNLEYAQLQTEEIKALEKCYWLVLVPLYSCMEKVISPDAFKQVYDQLNLIDVAFAIQSPSIIKQIARHLTKDELKTHVFYFSSLSQASKDDLRTLYLKEIDDPAIREPLLQIPNVAGVRLAFAENLQTLEDIFLSLTAPSYIDGPKVSVSLYSRELRYLKPEIVKEIMEGDNLCSQYKSAHRVCRLQVGDVDLHFKQKPSHPLMEYAIHNLTSRLAGNCTPPTVLVRFDLLNKSYPVLISQTIPGVALDASQPLDNKQWTWMLLAAILTRPGDGRPSNYTVHNQNIYCIDNDISFVEPVISAWNGRTVQFCSALFCLKPLDTPLNREVLQEFVSLDGAAILDGWIEDVIAKEQEYTALFSEAERKQLFEEDPKTACTFTILFREGTLANLNLQLWRLQTCIQKSFEEGSRLTVGDLLKQLISLREASIGAYVYKQYAKAMSTPFSERLAKATSRTQEASLTSVQYHQACLGKIPTLQEIERAKLYCPAKAREEFFFTLLQRCSTHAGIKIDKTGSSIEANFKLLVDKTRQTLVLKALASQAAATKPHTVILQHAIHLTNALLTPFIHPALKTLDLRYCSQIDNDAVDLIAQCPLLEKLYLSGTAIAAFRGGILSRTLKFLALKDFQIDRCLNLHTIQLRAPKLLTCTAKHNPLLETLQIKTAWNGTVDCANSPKAQVTHVQMECVSTLKGHTNGVTALVQLADGSLASGSWDNTIKLWDPVSGALKQTLTEHTDCISALVQLADGALASGSYDNTIKLWDPVSGALKQTLTGHTNSVCALVQLADGTLASGSYDKTIKLWDPVSGALKQTLKGHTGSVWTLVQLADGTLASVSNNNTIKLWDPVSGALKLTLKGHTSYVNVLVQLADGTLASGSSDETIKLWDPVSGALKQTLKGHTGSVRALVQLADGTLASGSFDTTIKLWDSISGALKQTLTGHTDWVIALVQLADGTLASGSSDNTIKLWQ